MIRGCFSPDLRPRSRGKKRSSWGSWGLPGRGSGTPLGLARLYSIRNPSTAVGCLMICIDNLLSPNTCCMQVYKVPALGIHGTALDKPDCKNKFRRKLFRVFVCGLCSRLFELWCVKLLNEVSHFINSWNRPGLGKETFHKTLLLDCGVYVCYLSHTSAFRAMRKGGGLVCCDQAMMDPHGRLLSPDSCQRRLSGHTHHRQNLRKRGYVDYGWHNLREEGV